MGLIHSYLAEIIESKPQQSDSKAYCIYIKEGNKIKQLGYLNEDFKKGDKVKYIGKRMWRSNLDPKKIYNVQDVVQDGKGGLTIIVNQYPVKAKDLKLAEDKINFSKKEMTKLHKDGTIKKGGNKYTFTNEGKLNEAKDYVYSKSSQLPFVRRLLQRLEMGMGTKPLSDHQISVIIDALYKHKIIESKLNEMQLTNKKTGKDVTKDVLAYLMGKINQKEFEKRTDLSKGEGKEGTVVFDKNKIK